MNQDQTPSELAQCLKQSARQHPQWYKLAPEQREHIESQLSDIAYRMYGEDENNLRRVFRPFGAGRDMGTEEEQAVSREERFNASATGKIHLWMASRDTNLPKTANWLAFCGNGAVVATTEEPTFTFGHLDNPGGVQMRPPLYEDVLARPIVARINRHPDTDTVSLTMVSQGRDL